MIVYELRQMIGVLKKKKKTSLRTRGEYTPTAIHSQIFTLQQASVLLPLLLLQVQVAPQTQTQTHLSSS